MTVDPGSGSLPAPMRIGSADRERTIDVLKAGFAEGRLTPDEHDERVALADAARTYEELAALLADLPAGPPGAVMCGPAAAYPPARMPVPPVINSRAVASLVCGLAEFPTLGLSALPAVVLGARARQEIRETGQRGEGLAVAGLVLGWIAITLFAGAVLAIIIWLLLPPGPGTGGPIGS
jgi:Domain of unknown function (DUF1707)/Domain of unknown function (DUF4190)